MTLFQLKIIGVVTMVIDHVGIFFFPNIFLFRYIGRLAFPIFAWTIANGYHYTQNRKRYFFRLLLFAIFSQIPFLLMYLVSGSSFSHILNIFFTLAYGVGVIMLFEKKYNKSWYRHFLMIVAILGGLLLPLEYGSYGVIMIFLFYKTFENRRNMCIIQTVLILSAMFIKAFFGGIFFGFVGYTLYAVNVTQLYSLSALPLLYIYSKTLGTNKYKWWFYWFYPAHLTILWIIYTLL